MDDLSLSLRLLLLLGVANVSPIVSKLLLGTRWGKPLDADWRLFDGRPLLGPSKTIRGFVSAVAGAAIASVLLGFSPVLGIEVGAFAMLGVAPSRRATGIDQIPEALLPLLMIRNALELSWLQIALITLVFFALEIPLSRLMFRLKLRNRPY